MELELPIRNRNAPALLRDFDSADELTEYEKNIDALRANQKYLDDNKETYESLVRDYGWMLEDPSTTDMVAEEYIRTGDPSKFINMKNTWKQNQLEKQRLAMKRRTRVRIQPIKMMLTSLLTNGRESVHRLPTNIVRSPKLSLNKLTRHLTS